MKTLATLTLAAMAACSLMAAPAPYPVTINSRAMSAPPLPVFRANEHTFRVSFTDGGTASDVTGYIPFLNWSTSSVAAVVSTSSWSIVTATNGTVDFTFDPTAINYPEGRYTYNVGVKTSNGVVRSYSQGVLQIYGSPTAAGASAVNWVANVDWNTIVWANLPSFNSDSTNAARAVVGASGTVWRAEWLAGDTNEAALRASGDAKSTNYTDAVAAGKVSTTDTRYLATLTNGSPHSSLSGIEGAGTLHVSDSETNKIATAWQNPASATNWTWTSDGVSATMTNYSGPSDVVIPDRVNNLPVTGVGTIFRATEITSISGGNNVTSLVANAFEACTALTSVTLPAATSITDFAFYGCTALTSVTLPAATSITDFAFSRCTALTSVTLPAATSIGNFAFNVCTALTSVILPAATSIVDYVFNGCTNLTSIYFGQNAPAEAADVYSATPNVTNYVTSSTATGWGATWNGRPVVRLPIYADEYWRHGTNMTDLLAGKLPTNTVPSDIGAATAADVTNIVAASASGNFVVRMTATKTTAFTLEPTNATYLGDCSGSALQTNAVISVLAGTNGAYVLAFGCTNSTFTTVQGTTVNYEFYCREGDDGSQTYKLEIYRRDLATDVLSEWGDGGPTFTAPTQSTPTLVIGSVYVPTISTNAFRIWARLKRVGGQATSDRTLSVGTGAGTPTYFSMTVPASVAIDAHNVSPTAHDNRWTPAGIAAAGGLVTNTAINLGTNTLTAGITTTLSTNGVGVRIVGVGKTGGADTTDGAMVSLYYNAAGNRQLYFGSTETGYGGLRVAGTTIDVVNWASGPQSWTLGTSLNSISVNSLSTTFNRLVTFNTNAVFKQSVTIETNLTVNGLSYIKLPSTAQTNGLASGVLYNDAGTIKVMP